MSLSVEEFNKEVIKSEDFNYAPIVRYLIANPHCVQFYNICKTTMEIFKDRDDRYIKRRKRSYDGYENKSHNNKYNNEHEEDKLEKLAEQIRDFRRLFRYFDFEKFYIMLMYNCSLLLNENDKKVNRFHFRYDQKFKVDLLNRLDFYIGSKETDISHYMYQRIRKLHPRKQMLLKSLNSIRDNYMFELENNIYIIVGWINDSNYKYIKICNEYGVIKKYEDLFTSLKKYDKSKNRLEDTKKVKNNYKDLIHQLDNFMNDDNFEAIELIDFIDNLSYGKINSIIKQLSLYRRFHVQFL